MFESVLRIFKTEPRKVGLHQIKIVPISLQTLLKRYDFVNPLFHRFGINIEPIPKGQEVLVKTLNFPSCSDGRIQKAFRRLRVSPVTTAQLLFLGLQLPSSEKITVMARNTTIYLGTTYALTVSITDKGKRELSFGRVADESCYSYVDDINFGVLQN